MFTRLAFWSRCVSEGDLWLLLLDEEEEEVATSDAGPFSARRMRSSHLRAGVLSSAPSTLPAFSGTISWNLREQPSEIRSTGVLKNGVCRHRRTLTIIL
jgi:hypothetical protein